MDNCPVCDNISYSYKSGEGMTISICAVCGFDFVTDQENVKTEEI